MKQTSLNRIHKEAGAKMVEFAGYEMPVEYTGIKDEHMSVRRSAGIFDVSHMGEFWIEGEHALDLVKKVSSNDPGLLNNGQAQYTCLPNGKGGIVDDLLVYCFNPRRYMLVVNASNIEKDWNWLEQQNELGAEMVNASDDISLLAVQGPQAKEILQGLTPIKLADIRNFHFVTGNLAGVDEVIISATGYTGAGGFELYVDNRHAEKIWKSVMEAGKDYGLKAAGLGARDTLRLEMGLCLYGNDIDETTSPIEAGLSWITKFNHDRRFIDRDFLRIQKTEGVSRKLRGFVLQERGIPRKGYEILNRAGTVVGQVTSGNISPVLNKGIGMGYVEREYAAFGTPLHIQIRNKKIPAEIVKMPFI